MSEIRFLIIDEARDINESDFRERFERAGYKAEWIEFGEIQDGGHSGPFPVPEKYMGGGGGSQPLPKPRPHFRQLEFGGRHSGKMARLGLRK